MSTDAFENSGRARRYFFVAMAAAVVVAVFAGFAPTFYLRSSFPQTRPMSVLLHIHGIVFSAWVTVFLAQSLLIAHGSRRLHRRVGWFAAGIAAIMVLLVIAAVIEQLRRVNGFPPPPLALALSAFDILVFAGLVGTAIHLRGRPAWHKRLMLSATIVLLGAPVFRIVLQILGRADMGKVGTVSGWMVDAFFLPCIAYDLITGRKIHPAYLWAIPVILIDQRLQSMVGSWPPWIHLSNALQRLVS